MAKSHRRSTAGHEHAMPKQPRERRTVEFKHAADYPETSTGKHDDRHEQKANKAVR